MTDELDTANALGVSWGSPFATAAELAELLHVHRSTISRWGSSGRLPCIRLPGTTAVRYPIEAVQRILKESTVDAQTERNKRIRDRACELAKETYVADLVDRQGHPTATIVISHPGQKPNLDPEYLRQNFGLRVDQVILLSESREAPTPWDPDAELIARRRELALLEAEVDRRRAADEVTVAEARGDVEKVEARRSPPAPRVKAPAE
jgi:excisionase family DNA binding protein